MLAIKNTLNNLLSALFLQKRRLYTIPLLTIGVVFLFAFLPLPAAALSLKSVLADIILWVAKGIGALVLTLIDILIQIAQYNDFINAPAVAKGWVIVRDVVNMFVIVMMLVIAFATTFRIEEYQYKKLLSKLLIMSVLVNFSKMLTGLFIDFSQVVMLTFVNGFKDAAAGNFVNGFHIADMYTFAKDGNAGNVDSGDYLIAAMLTFIALTITLVVVAVYVVIFLLRIAFLWLLTIVSPMAYVLSAFPGQAKKYSTEWWETFGKYLTSGPILAFFLWLSLAIMQFDSDAFGKAFKASDTTGGQGASGVVSASISDFGKSDVLLSFIINIVMLLGGLWMAQRLGVAGGKLAGSALSKIQQAGAAPFKLAGRGALGVGKWGLNRLDDTQAAVQKRLMKTGAGQWLAKTKIGERLGLGRIGEHGIQLRSIPHAWQERAARKERERLGASAGVAEDIMSRTLSIGKDKPNKTAEINAKLATEAAKEVTAVATDWEHLASEIDEAMDYSSGRPRVRSGKEHLVEGLLVELSKTHDPNEVLKHTRLGKEYGLEYTSQNVVKFLKDAFGGGKTTETVARVAFRMQETGLMNSDGLLKGIARMRHGHYELPDWFEESVAAVQSSDHNLTEEQARTRVLSGRRNRLMEAKRNELALRDPAQGGYGRAYGQLTAVEQAAVSATAQAEIGAINDDQLIDMIRKEEQGKVASAFIAKRTFRSIANQARFQDFLAEIADTQGNRYGGKLVDVGIANVTLNGAAIAQHYNAMNEETKKYLGLAADQFVKYFEENADGMQEEERDNWHRFITAITIGKQVIQDSDKASAQELHEHIATYTSARNDVVRGVNNDRRANDIRDVEDVELHDDAPIYNIKRIDLYHVAPPKQQQQQPQGTPRPQPPGGGGRGPILDQYGNPITP